MVEINVIATNKYIEFVQPLVDSIDRYFLTCDITLNLFTNDLNKVKGTNRVTIREHEIMPYAFPEATLLRYHIMSSISYKGDYIFYLDADMLINDFVGDEVLGELVAVRHPGYFHHGGSWETNEKSSSFVPINYRKKYFAGGFQGGQKNTYLAAMLVMKELINQDRKNDIMPIWHDESAWNKYLSVKTGYNELTPSYCMPQAWAKRMYSKIQDLPAKILALEKDFNYYR